MAKKYRLIVNYNYNKLVLITYDKDKIDQEVKDLLDDSRLENMKLEVLEE